MHRNWTRDGREGEGTVERGAHHQVVNSGTKELVLVFLQNVNFSFFFFRNDSIVPLFSKSPKEN